VFGELIRTIAAPGLPAEQRAIAWDGGTLLITTFAKVVEAVQFDPATLRRLGSRVVERVPGAAFTPGGECWMGMRVGGSPAARRRQRAGRRPDRGRALDPMGTLTTVSSGWTWRRYLPPAGGGQWPLAFQKTVAPPGTGNPGWIPYDPSGFHLYAGASPDGLGNGVVRQLDAVTFHWTGSAALPVADAVHGCAVVDERLLVAVDGTTDLIFELSTK
jgi:hypothetical protein